MKTYVLQPFVVGAAAAFGMSFGKLKVPVANQQKLSITVIVASNTSLVNKIPLRERCLPAGYAIFDATASIFSRRTTAPRPR